MSNSAQNQLRYSRHTEPLAAHNPLRRKSEDQVDLNLRRFRKRVSGKLASIINRLKLAATIEDRDLGSQRMCPFCGLITSRYKACCLECGKSLKPA
jgi:hypothetical protein